MNLVIIIGILFLALIILVPLIEKSNMRVSEESTAKISRWIYPLLIISVIAVLLKNFL